MWHKSQEIDYESELNNDPDYHTWSDKLRDESESTQNSPKTALREDFSDNGYPSTPKSNKRLESQENIK